MSEHPDSGTTNTLRRLVRPSDPWRRSRRVARVDFALGSATVRAIACRRRAPDGEMVYHVEDARTGHQDFVGASYMRPVASPEVQP
jgi:hypothetical protein